MSLPMAALALGPNPTSFSRYLAARSDRVLLYAGASSLQPYARSMISHGLINRACCAGLPMLAACYVMAYVGILFGIVWMVRPLPSRPVAAHFFLASLLVTRLPSRAFSK